MQLLFSPQNHFKFIVAGILVLLPPALGATDLDALSTAAHKALAAGDYRQAESQYETLLTKTNLLDEQRDIVRLRCAQIAHLVGDRKKAQSLYSQIAVDSAVCEHHRAEAARELRHIQDPGDKDEPKGVAALPRQGATRKTFLFVSPEGNDANPGTRTKPFATLERARDEIRSWRQAGSVLGPIEVVIAGGTYDIRQTFVLEQLDSGTEGSPITYRARDGERPLISGGRRLTGARKITDPEVVKRLPASTREHALEFDLVANGITKIPPLILGGFGSGRGFRSHPSLGLYVNEAPCSLAKGPGQGSYVIAKVPDEEVVRIGKRVGSKVGRFTYSGDPAWLDDPDLLLYGYWYFGWADSYERIASIDKTRKEIQLEPPFHGYGYCPGQPFWVINALSELDSPHEWVLDRVRKRIYLLPDPASKQSRARFELSVFEHPFLQLTDVSNVRFENLTWNLGCADGILVRGGSNCVLAGCTVSRLGGNGVEISGGRNHSVVSSDIHTLGRGGIVLTAGDRKTLMPGGHLVENCHVFDLSRIDRTYTPAVLCSGTGQRVAHNLFHDIPSSAMRINGNDHLIEYNEVTRVVLESDDQGAVDMWGDPTYLGNVYRRNYFHHIGKYRLTDEQSEHGQAAIRLDDAISGVLMTENVFHRCGAGKIGFGAIQIHGGKNNIIDKNLFADCRSAISFSPWSKEHWERFVTPFLESREIDAVLYRQRYPAMQRMNRDLNVNWFWRNQFVNCGEIFKRDAAGARVFDNLVLTSVPPAQKSLNTFLNSKVFKHTQPWFRRVGLYQNEYRRQVDTELIEEMRSE